MKMEQGKPMSHRDRLLILISISIVAAVLLICAAAFLWVYLHPELLDAPIILTTLGKQ